MDKEEIEEMLMKESLRREILPLLKMMLYTSFAIVLINTIYVIWSSILL